jgi:hypothetical protein
VSILTIDGAAELLVREWQKHYNRSPVATVVVTIVAILVGGTAIYVTEQRSAAEREAKRLQSQSYVTQAQLLDETRVNLRALLSFIEDERRNLKASEQALLSLKREHEQLKPLVETDRKTIDALFAAQEARNQAAQSTERWIGFGLGVVSSLVASLLWAVFSYVRRRSQGATAA